MELNTIFWGRFQDNYVKRVLYDYVHFLQDQENVIICIVHPSYRICITMTFLLQVAPTNNSTEIVICMMPVKDY